VRKTNTGRSDAKMAYLYSFIGGCRRGTRPAPRGYKTVNPAGAGEKGKETTTRQLNYQKAANDYKQPEKHRKRLVANRLSGQEKNWVPRPKSSGEGRGGERAYNTLWGEMHLQSKSVVQQSCCEKKKRVLASSKGSRIE